MDITNVGLVLEGGGMRGVYTSGVLDFFLDRDLHFQYMIGVSAGACQSFSYVSRQRGRSFKVNADFIRDPRYLSLRNFLREGSIFGMDFMFDEIPKKLEPFDYTTFNNTKSKVAMVVTNCATGQAEYFYNTDGHDMFLICRASSSMPLAAPMVPIGKGLYLDGGVADPIPIRQAIKDGYEKNVVVLTRNRDYRKKPSGKVLKLLRKVYKDYPAIAESYSRRHEVYNSTLAYIETLEKEGKVFVLRPQRPVTVSRTEKNSQKLMAFYNKGLDETMASYAGLQKFLGID